MRPIKYRKKRGAMRFPEFYSFRTKMILIYAFLTILPLTLSFFVFLQRWREDERQNYVQLMAQFNGQIAEGFHAVIENTSQLIGLFRTDTRLLNILSENPSYDMERYYSDLTYIKDFIRRSKVTNPYLVSVNYLSANRLLYGSADRSEQFISLIQSFAQRAGMTGRSRYISPIYRTAINYRDVTALTISQSLKNPYSQKNAGYAFLTFDFQDAISSLMDSGSQLTSAFFIAQHGQVVFRAGNAEQSLPEQIHRLLLQEYHADYNYRRQFIVKLPDGSSYLVARYHDQIYNYHIFQYVSMNFVDRSFRNSIAFYVVMVLTVLAGVLLVALSFSFRTSKTIRRLLGAMEQIESGVFSQIGENRTDELGGIITGFNTMSRKLEGNMHAIRMYSEKQQEYQLKLLEAQINPHFVYNTLNLISSISYLEANGPVVKISNSLARMLYYNLKASQTVPLRDEIEQYKRYIAIQKLRFVEKIIDLYDIDESLLEIPVPKFILQPLLENSVNHGLVGKTGQGEVMLKIARATDILLISVSDDGVGISPETLKEIHMNLKLDEDRYLLGETIENVGILNVHHRIRRAYGTQYGLEIESIPGAGTTVTIKMPDKSAEGQGPSA